MYYTTGIVYRDKLYTVYFGDNEILNINDLLLQSSCCIWSMLSKLYINMYVVVTFFLSIQVKTI